MTVHIEAVTFENIPEELLSIKFYISLCIASLSLLGDYRISSDIRRIFSFQNNLKDLDPSYKTDLDL